MLGYEKDQIKWPQENTKENRHTTPCFAGNIELKNKPSTILARCSPYPLSSLIPPR